MVAHGGSSAGSYLTDPTSPIPSHCASIVATSTLRVKISAFKTSTPMPHGAKCGTCSHYNAILSTTSNHNSTISVLQSVIKYIRLSKSTCKENYTHLECEMRLLSELGTGLHGIVGHITERYLADMKTDWFKQYFIRPAKKLQYQ